MKSPLKKTVTDILRMKAVVVARVLNGGLCTSSRRFATGKSVAQAWRECPDMNWLDTMARACGVDEKKIDKANTATYKIQAKKDEEYEDLEKRRAKAWAKIVTVEMAAKALLSTHGWTAESARETLKIAEPI